MLRYLRPSADFRETFQYNNLFISLNPLCFQFVFFFRCIALHLHFKRPLREKTVLFIRQRLIQVNVSALFKNSGRCRSLFVIVTSIWFMPHDTAWDFLTRYPLPDFILFLLVCTWYDITLFVRLFLYTLIINVLLVVSILFFVIFYLYSLSLSRRVPGGGNIRKIIS